MPIFENIVIRCALFPDDTPSETQFVTVATSKAPSMYKGAQVALEFCLFKSPEIDANNPAVLYDITNFVGLPKFKIRLANAAGNVLLDDGVAGVVPTKDATCTLAQWLNGSSQHFRFFLPETVTGITAGAQYIVIYGPDGDVFGKSTIYVVDPGTDAGSPPTPSPPTAYSKTEMQGILLDYLPKQLEIDQPIFFLCRHPVSGQVARITLAPTFDDQGIRLVQHTEVLP